MFKNESVRTLYRGVSSPLLFLTSINAIVFGTASANKLSVRVLPDNNLFPIRFTNRRNTRKPKETVHRGATEKLDLRIYLWLSGRRHSIDHFVAHGAAQKSLTSFVAATERRTESESDTRYREVTQRLS